MLITSLYGRLSCLTCGIWSRAYVPSLHTFVSWSNRSPIKLNFPCLNSCYLRHNDAVEFVDLNNAEHLIHDNMLKVGDRCRLEVKL